MTDLVRFHFLNDWLTAHYDFKVYKVCNKKADLVQKELKAMVYEELF